MTAIPRALIRAIASQMHPRMLALTLLPFCVAAAFWGVILWGAWEPMANGLQRILIDSSFAGWISQAAVHIGLDQVSWHWQTFAAPVLLAILLAPAIVLTVFAVIGAIAAPIAVRHVAREYPAVLPRSRDSFLASLWNTMRSAAVFVLCWFASMPLWLIPPLGLVIPVVLWGWLTYRVMIFDALALHADRNERDELMRSRRLELWLLGTLVAALGAVPTLIWIGGAAVFVFAPLFAMITLWLYVLVFTYSALAFAHFGLDALARRRSAGVQQVLPS